MVKGFSASDTERSDNVEEEWPEGVPGYVRITPSMCVMPYKREETKPKTTPPKKKKPTRQIKNLVKKLPSFDDWELEVR